MRIKQRRKGATIIVIALLIPALFFIIGFSVDLAYMQQARSEIRIATDLAAKAASVELADTGNQNKAITRGKEVAAANLVGGSGLVLEDSSFVFGNADRNFTSRWDFTPNATPLNAVQIQANTTTRLFLSGFLAGKAFQPSASSVASFVEVDVCLVLDRSTSMKQAVDDPSTEGRRDSATLGQTPLGSTQSGDCYSGAVGHVA